MKHLALVPLIGGLAIGAENAIGGPPEAVLSYSAFNGNDALYMKYLAQRGLDTKRYIIGEDEIPTFSDIDIVTSVCPCAGLSSATVGSGPGCKQNEWMKISTDHVLSTVRPRVLIGENAPALATNNGRPVAQALQAIGAKYGYSMQLVKTSTHLHGIPQKRVRSFFILFRDTGPLEIQYSHNESEGSWTDYLDSFETQEDEAFTLSDWHNELWELGKRIKKMEEKEFAAHLLEIKETTLSICIEENEIADAFVETYLDGKDKVKQRIAKDIVRCRTKKAMGKRWWDSSVFLCDDKNYKSVMWRTLASFWRPDHRRPLNLREQMRLMGLPDEFEAPRGNPNAICQNVPTCTAEWMVREAIAGLNGERKEWDGQGSLDGILRQNNINMKYMK
jgi:site-specific DNA-cytosine methylase